MRCALLSALLLCNGCLRTHELFGSRADGGLDGGAQGPMPWGTFAGQLSVPQCPEGPVLIVNTVQDELADAGISDPAQAGPFLSLREAIEIAANGGASTIYFDQAVFPVDAPGVIEMNSLPAYRFVSLNRALCIDGRDRGVIIRWSTSAFDEPARIWNLLAGSLQVGLTLENVPFEQTVSGAQVAGCRYGTDGYVTFPSGRFWVVELANGAQLGPGNVMAGYLTTRTAAGVTRIEENFFGYDPLTKVVLPTTTGIDMMYEASIERNVFMTTGAAVAGRVYQYGISRLANNRVGVDAPSSTQGPLAQLYAGRWVIGPGNVVRATEYALTANTFVHLTQNSFVSPRGVATTIGPQAPSIDSLSGGRLSGSCVDAGTIEVFEGLGEKYLATTACAASRWSMALATDSGQQLSANLTDGTEDAGLGTSAFSPLFLVP